MSSKYQLQDFIKILDFFVFTVNKPTTCNMFELTIKAQYYEVKALNKHDYVVINMPFL